MARIRRIVPLFLSGCALLALPAQASAQKGCGDRPVPAGDSHLEQYLETVPGSCGDQQLGPGGGQAGGAGQDGGGAGSAVPASTAEELQALGPEGARAVQLALAGTPADAARLTAGGGGASAQDDGGAGSAAAGADGASTADPGDYVATAEDQSVLAALASEIGGVGGFAGIAVFVLVAVAGVAYFLHRRSIAG